MSIEEAGYYILGITNNGNKFRPSDWVERIASIFANFDSNRLRYNALLRPAKHDGQNCLFIASRLADHNPTMFNFVMDFAHSHQILVTDTNSPFHDLPPLQNVA